MTERGMAWAGLSRQRLHGELVGFASLEHLLTFLEREAFRLALDQATPRPARNESDSDERCLPGARRRASCLASYRSNPRSA
jgi:hypothetical protein